jgi:hypothetical protein
MARILRERLLRRVWNWSRIASICGKSVILRRLAGRRSNVRRIRRVGCERVRRVAGLGRRWRHSIHVDAFPIGPRSGCVLRGRDAGAQKQRCKSERNVRHPVVLAFISPTANANTAIQVPPGGWRLPHRRRRWPACSRQGERGPFLFVSSQVRNEPPMTAWTNVPRAT